MTSDRKLRVDFSELLEAVTLPPGHSAYLNVESGKVITLIDELDGEGEEDALRAEVEEHPEKFEAIPQREGREDYADMSRFAETIEEEDIRERLQTALAGRGAFGRFRDQVQRYPDIAARWHATRQRVLVEYALQWLHSLGIEPEYELPPPPATPAPTKPQPARAAGPKVHLEHLLVLGAPDGKTEILEGKIEREFTARSEAEARQVFKTVVRDLCEYAGEAWRNRFIEGQSEFTRREMTIRVRGTRVSIECAYPREILQEFGFFGGRDADAGRQGG
ncbi:MAG: hypothetical protein HZA54_06155 [Planctomycetes bacterium]|nr:hypothetical protein [Planctomycetota bacterium]